MCRERSRPSGVPCAVPYWFRLVRDRLLRLIAGTLVGSVRASDVVARIGGDEFVALLPEAGDAQARAAMDRIVEAVRVRVQCNGWPVTMSGGVVTFEVPPASTREMLAQADRLMYAAKASGKNRPGSNQGNTPWRVVAAGTCPILPMKGL